MTPGKITIRDLDFDAILGVLSFERERPQPVRLNFSLWLNFETIAKTDSLKDTVDYAAISEDLVNFIQESQFGLVETLVYQTAKRLLSYSPLILAAWVRIEKPEAIPHSKGSAAEIRLEQER